MAGGKKTVELVQTSLLYDDGWQYRVAKLTNTVELVIGEMLYKPEVEAFIRRPGWTVIIKGKGSR